MLYQLRLDDYRVDLGGGDGGGGGGREWHGGSMIPNPIPSQCSIVLRTVSSTPASHSSVPPSLYPPRLHPTPSQ
ncbi:hypothetical protein E2C01_097614 [Portunus trituberculatus]|uniref:Uncharacterized protein n=1 Tax=Portunus trituberculatus TaxID=210409 RepID=A0A5B7KAF8_PORTR|nr:hypothetical protein [Portunus trituberculatus]